MLQPETSMFIQEHFGRVVKMQTQQGKIIRQGACGGKNAANNESKQEGLKGQLVGINSSCQYETGITIAYQGEKCPDKYRAT